MTESLFRAYRRKKQRIGVGVLSGTSLDGIDVAIVGISGFGETTEVKLLATETYPFEPVIRRKIFRNLNPETARLPELSQLHFLIGKVFADATKKLLGSSKIKSGAVDFIASHGQTFWHQPAAEKIGRHQVRSTFQLGESAVIAAELGVLTVSDFRVAEIPLGGDGAPLAPFLDYILYRSSKHNRALLNIGGMSNITAMKQGCKRQEVIFFDCGPGNVLIDKAAALLFGKPFDQSGKFAAKGSASETALKTLLRLPYLKQVPPKSTGRELFSDAYFENALARCRSENLNDFDIIATLTEFTARVVAAQYQKFIAPHFKIDELVVSGGGARNKTLMRSLEKKFYFAAVKDHASETPTTGIPAKAKEAVLFAVLGNELLCGGSASMKTGAMLGKLSFPPQ
ncbi:MAG: anhydro-N-acetylmuramic acid kinase [Rhizobacter sp.]|nr:anhydro-N-acetylmuramic acid kinase [Chlorobiales bacterium]